MLQKVAKVAKSSHTIHKYYCEYCDYTTSKTNNYNKHLLTKKHQKNVTNCNKNNVTKSSHKSTEQLSCEFCGKNYKNRMSLWRHKKKCPKVENEEKSPENFYLKKIAALEAKLEKVELAQKNPQHITNNIQNNVTQNIIIIDQNTFLSKLANNALNIEDFVKQLKLDQNDYNFALENGYQKGVANVIIKQLENLDDTQRPIHSTDKKRGKFLVKTKGEWKKDNGESVDHVITSVGNKLNTYDIGHITAEDFKDPEVMELYQKQTLKLATKSDPKEKVKENKKIKSQLADSISIKEALENANKKIEN